MKIGIIAGNRNLPVLLAKRIAQSNKFTEIVGVCFRGETSRFFCSHVNKCFWVRVGSLGSLKKIIQESGITDWVMAGQINPLNIFKKKNWDSCLKELVSKDVNFCPHSIFQKIINYLQQGQVNFIDSTFYLKEDLSDQGLINNLGLIGRVKEDVNFGLDKISKFVETDIGQTLVVKSRAVVAVESLEGTDRTIKRGFRLAGPGAVVFKFARESQDSRFDVPVVGISTLKLLKKIKASALVLQSKKVIILEKDKFLDFSRKWKIPVIGANQPGEV